MTEEKVALNLRVPVSLRDWLKERAAREDRSMNYLAREVLSKARSSEKKEAA